MHTFEMPKHVTDRVVARRGTAHPYDNIDPSKTALVVIDLQNGFMKPGVAHALCDMAREIVPNVNRLAETVRATGGTVVWIRNTFTDETLESWSHMHECLTLPERKQKRIEAMSEGTEGHELWADLVTAPEDLTIKKYRYSALIQGSSDLEAQLRARGLDTVLITGCVTNVCCESTARDAMMLNFKTLMVSDANAASNDEEHAASLIAFYLTFGDVMTTDEVCERLVRNAAPSAVAAE
ncbi:isochorismatase family protein [Microvirga pudoricolor]|uniref:isochorismatase family protein n=1 Tax=Microvirga pudoricolor TaxID=2778729 RepID=UPI00194F84E3|nr:isochorismatase family cysteine hydrolase [Microvirga pudoricolor]MBM6595221.1 cysteine hydrolase [Microvirga pudoricolor]